jgi:hypothetical protein
MYGLLAIRLEELALYSDVSGDRYLRTAVL